MHPSDDVARAAVFDFVNDFIDDRERGRPRALSEYLVRFAGFEDAIAAEYLRLLEEQAAPARPTDDRRVAHYRLLKELGAGGQGAVYLAEDTRIARRVALKLLRGGLVTDERRRRLKREAESIARLRHPGVCAIFEAEVEGDVPYIAMQFLEGTDLGTGIALAAELREAGLDPPQPWLPARRAELFLVLAFFEQAARALHAAHEAGVLHRDVKPGNLIVTPEGRPVILDFGLAQDVDREVEQLTRSGEMLGTPAYMAPEQLRGAREEVGPATDVYALGVTLYEALTGERPFGGENRLELERAILFSPPPDPRARNALLGVDVKVVLETALDKDPARRYPSAHEFAEDLRRIRAFEPVKARRAGVALRLARWARRQPAVAVAVVSTFVLLSVSLAIALTLLADVRRALDLSRGRLWTDRVAELIHKDPAAALALGIEAHALAPGFRSRSALYAPLETSQLLRVHDLPERDLYVDVAIDPTGAWLAAAASDGSLWVFDEESGAARVTGLVVAPPGAEQRQPTLRIAFDARGERLAFGAADGTVGVVTIPAGELLWRERLPGPVTWVEFSPGGEELALQPHDGAAELRDAARGVLRARLDNAGHGHGLARFDPSGARLVTASVFLPAAPAPSAETAELWDVQGGARIATLAGHTGAVRCAAFDPTGARLVTVSADATARLWDARTGAPLCAPLVHPGPLGHAAFAPDGARLVTSSSDRGRGGAWLWDLASGACTELAGHQGPVYSSAFRPDGAQVATCALDTTARIWDGRSGAPVRTCRAYMRPVRVVWSPDGRRLVVLSNSQRLFVFRSENPPYAYRLLAAEPGVPLTWCAFAPDAARAVTGAADGTLRVHATPAAETRAGAQEPGALLGRLQAGCGAVHGGAFDATGARLLAWGAGDVASVWDLERLASVRLLEHEGPAVAHADLAPDGRRAVTVDADGRVRLWDLAAGTHAELARDAPARLASFAGGGALLLTAGAGERVEVRDGASGAVLREFTWQADRGAADVVCMAVSRERVVVGCADHYLRFFDPATGRSARPALYTIALRWVRAVGERVLVAGLGGGGSVRALELDTGVRPDDAVHPTIYHEGLITSIGLDPTGALALTSSEDGSAFVWDAESGAVRSWYTLHDGRLMCAAFSPVADDRRVLSVASDGSAAVWPIEPERAALLRRGRALDAWERAKELGE